MADCRKCKHNYKMPGDEPRCNLMCDGESDFEPITNAEKIRSMNDEELAEFLERIRKTGFNGLCCNDDLCDSDGCDCCMEEWLKSEAE